MVRFEITLLILLLPMCGLAQLPHGVPAGMVEEIECSKLPDSPGALLRLSAQDHANLEHAEQNGLSARSESLQSRAPAPKSYETEPYHWKGLLLQSFAFNMLSNATRIITADQSDRHLLLNKPYWSDYWASLQQFNMRRWNDGDSIKVNYIGHPMEGAIAGISRYRTIRGDASCRFRASANIGTADFARSFGSLCIRPTGRWGQPERLPSLIKAASRIR